MLYIIGAVTLINLIAVIYLVYKTNKSTNFKALDNSQEIKKMSEDIDGIRRDFASIDSQLKAFSQMVGQSINNLGASQLENIRAMGETQTNQISQLEQRVNGAFANNEARLERVTQTISTGLEKIQALNSQELEKMRATVDEKLDKTLNDRLNSSFSNIMQTLENVQKSAGEMKSAVDSVADFKKLMTGVKTRGTWGEVQLGNVLEQMLSPNQFESQVSIDGGSERVDFVVKLPGKNQDEIIYLPIDAKFPIEDYSRLCDASEQGDKALVEKCAKELERKIKEQAKSINKKYIKSPKTTEFAVMYLPIEGLYAEVVKNSNLCEILQREYRVMICGPNTVTALLSSLQMGFKTLAIEKRSGEIWNLLGVFKHEFTKFTEMLDKTKKHLDGASDTIEDATKKTKTIEKKLKSVADIGESEIDKISFDEE